MHAPTSAALDAAIPIAEPDYADATRLNPAGVRGRVRSAALSALAAIARRNGSTAAGLRRPRVHFIYLHHVFRDEEAGFRALLESLAQTHEFLSHGDAIGRVRDGRIDRAYASFSFDDGFIDNLRAAAVLEDYGARGCFFVCPGIVGERDPKVLEAFCSQRLRFRPATSFLDWAQLERLRDNGHEIGGHTMTHPDLGAVAVGEARDEIARSYEAIAARLGAPAHFAWPLGRWQNMSPEARAAAFDAGFTTCSSAVRGAHVAPAGGPREDLCIRRDHVLANWPLDHIHYLLGRSALAASPASNDWPPDYPRLG